DSSLPGYREARADGQLSWSYPADAFFAGRGVPGQTVRRPNPECAHRGRAAGRRERLLCLPQTGYSDDYAGARYGIDSSRRIGVEQCGNILALHEQGNAQDVRVLYEYADDDDSDGKQYRRSRYGSCGRASNVYTELAHLHLYAK